MAVYLDYNASAPIDERVLERMIEVYRSHYGNAEPTSLGQMPKKLFPLQGNPLQIS